MVQALIEAEAAQQIGAGRYVRSASRITHRNGSRARLLSTKAGDVELHIPRLREDSFFAALLEPRRRIDRALLAVAMEAYVHALSSAAASLALDLDGHATGRVKTLLFAPTALAASGDGPGEGADGSTGGGEAPRARPCRPSMPTVFRARAVTTSSGTFGHIRIFAFSVQDPVAFVNEFIRLIGLLPQDGLVIDVRDNGGGHIYASEFTLHENFPIAGRPGLARPEPQGLRGPVV